MPFILLEEPLANLRSLSVLSQAQEAISEFVKNVTVSLFAEDNG